MCTILLQLFEKVEVTKPVASRATSAEIYVVGLKYRAPGKIDPRLLDSRHLFQEVEEAPKVCITALLFSSCIYKLPPVNGNIFSTALVNDNILSMALLSCKTRVYLKVLIFLRVLWKKEY